MTGLLLVLYLWLGLSPLWGHAWASRVVRLHAARRAARRRPIHPAYERIRA